MKADNEQLKTGPKQPGWARDRRLRFCKILQEGKRTLKLNPEERALCFALAELIKKNNAELE